MGGGVTDVAVSVALPAALASKVVDTFEGKGKSDEGFDAAENVNEFTQLHSANAVVMLHLPSSSCPSSSTLLVPSSLPEMSPSPESSLW